MGIFSQPQYTDEEMSEIERIKSSLQAEIGDDVKMRFGEEADAVLSAMAKQRILALREHGVAEAGDDYFKTYSDAVRAALSRIPSEFTYDDDEYHGIVATGKKKPNYDDTTHWKLPLYNKKGEHKKYLVVSVYNRSKDGSGKPYELTAYVS